MALFQSFDMRADQRLKMTPQLQQAIQLLQLSNLELVNYLQEEAERNPFMELQQEGEGVENSYTRQAEKNSDVQSSYEGEAGIDSVYKEGTVHIETGTSESSYDNVYDTDYGSDKAIDNTDYDPQVWDSVRSIDSQFDDDDKSSNFSESPSLHEHLTKQLMLSHTDIEEKTIAYVMIGSLDEAGYLRDSLEEVASRLGISVQKVEQVLHICQQFEPTGIFARSLSECLKLQLIDHEILTPKMEILLDNLELLGKREMNALMKLLDCDKDQLQKMVSQIRRLNPKPASEYDSTQAQTVIPDVVIKREPLSGGWSVELNNQTMPKVIVNRGLCDKMKTTSETAKDEGMSQFVAQNVQTAKWLESIVHRRSTTILRVATEIVRQQDGFFEFGISHLRPMNLKAIAEVLEMHESTISRVTSNKYLRCPRGIFELKFFFMSGISDSNGGDMVASEAVKSRIKAFIENEKQNHILSDDEIVTLLLRDGIKIARRTVAKYREAMNIPSSVDRRRQKKGF